jgi:hypothetical protein
MMPNLFYRVASHFTHTTAISPHSRAIYLCCRSAYTTGRCAQPGVNTLLSKHEGSCRSSRIECLASSILLQAMQYHMLEGLISTGLSR